MNNSLRLDQLGTITIIQTAFIGDAALALFLAERIRCIAPGCHLRFVTTPQSASLPRIASAVDETIVYDKRGKDNGLKGIRKIASDISDSECIIAPHRSLRTTLIIYFAKPEVAVGFDRNAFSTFYRRTVKYHSHLHEIERNNMLLMPFEDFEGNIGESPVPELDLSDVDISFADDFLNSEKIIPPDIIAVAPGSVWETKRWPVWHFVRAINILKRFGVRICLIGGPADNPVCKEIAELTGVTNFAGRTSIPQSIKLLQRVDAVLTNDSAPTHFAQLAGVPCATIFGPTVPDFGFAPRGSQDRIIEYGELNCRPCAIHGGRKCPIGTHECMRNISAERVAEELMDMTF
jgi:heptosyltransferase-2